MTVNFMQRSPAEVEDLIIDDLLYCLMGISGENIQYKNGEFVLNQSLDPAMQELCKRTLVLPQFFHSITKFSEGIHASI